VSTPPERYFDANGVEYDYNHLLPKKKGLVCKSSTESPLPEWQPDRDRWCREPYTHTISVVDIRHWLPHLNMGNYALVADEVRFGDLYVWCERGRDDGPVRAEWGRALSIGDNTCVMLTTSGHRRIITPSRHPFRFRVVGQPSTPKGYAPYPRSETPAAVTARLCSKAATACMEAVVAHAKGLDRAVDAIRSAQAFVRFQVEKTPDDSEHVHTYATGHSVLTAIADTAVREMVDICENVQAFLEASPDLAALMKADEAARASTPAQGDA
jgi:hypothetical protein